MTYTPNLAPINIPASVTSIGESAFYCCFALMDVTVNWTATNQLPTMGSSVFWGIAYSGPEYATLHVPAGTKAIYEAAEQWEEFGKIVEDDTALPSLLYEGKVGKGSVKFIHNGQLIIRQGEKNYCLLASNSA